LGELDSVEGDSDDISDEFEFSHEILASDGKPLRSHHLPLVNPSSSFLNVDKENKMNQVSNRSEDKNIQELNSLSRKELLLRYLDILREKSGGNNFQAYQVRQVDEEDLYATPLTPTKSPKLTQNRHSLMGDQNEDRFLLEGLDEGGRGSEATTDPTVFNLRDEGAFDQQDEGDESREEPRSSWSSSEEALQACQGLIFNVPLAGTTGCTTDANRQRLTNISTEVNHNEKSIKRINGTTYYYYSIK